MTAADLPTWLPAWDVLLSIALVWYLGMQIFSLVAGICLSAVAIRAGYEADDQGIKMLANSSAGLILLFVIVTVNVMHFTNGQIVAEQPMVEDARPMATEECATDPLGIRGIGCPRLNIIDEQ